jgi:hypothetical protein
VAWSIEEWVWEELGLRMEALVRACSPWKGSMDTTQS